MTDYSELVKALRYCSTTKGMVYCNVNCKYGWEERSKGCKDLLMTDAAASIEELDAEETRLLLLTSDLQDKLMDLQAEVKRLELDNEDYEHEQRRLKGDIEALQAQLPKRGEWEPFDLTYGRSIYSCSVCEQATEVPMCMEKPMYAYCPNCGAKMEDA